MKTRRSDAVPVVPGRTTVLVASLSIVAATLPGCGNPDPDDARAHPSAEPRLAAPATRGDGWKVQAPHEAGPDTAILRAMAADLRRSTQYRNVHAVLIAKRGRLVYEQHLSGEDRRWRAGGIESVAIDFHPEHEHLVTPAKRRITVHDALTMSAGLARDGPRGWAEVVNPAGNVWLRPRDLARFGQLFLNDGRWNGVRVLPPGWAGEATRRRLPAGLREDARGGFGYGYLWWHDVYPTEVGDVEVHTAAGNGGRRVYAIPSLDLLVVVLAGGYDDPDAFWMPERLLLDHVVPAARASDSAAGDPLALAHVNVVDVETGRVLPDRTVLIAGNRVRAVDSRPPPPGARVIDAGGGYLIPGLWDMHTHNFDLTAGYDLEGQFALLVANGNTGVRDVGAAGIPLEEIGSIRTAVLEGRLTGPRFIAAGPLVDGPERRHVFSAVPGSPEHARRVVDSLASAGADFIKVYSNLRASVYRAVADQAERRGIPFAGHLPDRVDLHEALALGQRSFEHLHAVRRVCSGADDDLADWWVRWEEALASGADTLALVEEVDEIVVRLRTAHDEAACRRGLARMAETGAALAPTMVVKRPDLVPLEELERDDRLRYIPPATREWWMEDMEGRIRASAEEREATRRRVERERALVPVAARAGVLLLAATDVTNEYTYPGFSLHDELALFVERGLTPLEALRTATLNPAVFLGATDSLGTVAPGKVADLVLLDANPLDDIRNTRRIAGVVLNGRYLDRHALDSLLAGVERAVRDAARE